MEAVVLVEGLSDKLALEALAERLGRSLDAEGISVVAMGGATNIGKFLDRLGPKGLGVKLAGLCDANEEKDFRRAMEHAGLGTDLTRDGMEKLGFFVCVADLEDELIRSLGAGAVEEVIGAQGELRAFRVSKRSLPGVAGLRRLSYDASWVPIAGARSSPRYPWWPRSI